MIRKIKTTVRLIRNLQSLPDIESDIQKLNTANEEIINNTNTLSEKLSLLDNSLEHRFNKEILNTISSRLDIIENLQLSLARDLHEYTRPSSMHRENIRADWEESPYYDDWDNEKGLTGFWGEATPFFRLFSELDCDVVMDLACGRGRHSAQILQLRSPTALYLVDINKSNIAHCRKRFADDARVHCFVNDGCKLSHIADNSLTAIISYDAMVHFEYDDVISYIKEFSRVLSPGGKALIHHSNNDRQPGNTYQENPHWRNFMSAPLFKHAAIRSGLNVVEQVLMDWGDSPMDKDLDCLSLLEKPAA
ncbi:class I SAM-dependent methyltransferase [Azospirillum sp. Marseille-Q6669]